MTTLVQNDISKMVKDQLKRKEEHKKLLAAERLVNQHKKTIEELKATNKQKEELGVEWANCPIGLPTADECMEEICRAYEYLITRKGIGY